MKIIDTHAHIEGEEYDNDRAEMLARMKENDVVAVVNMGCDIESSEKAVALTKEYDCVFTGVGVHPSDIFALTEKDLAYFADLTKEERVVAIGEIGLDYYWEKDGEKRELQRRMFVAQLDLARQLHLPVCIHDREAHGDTMDILKREGRGIGGVIHCFSGSPEMAVELVKLGWYLGIDGPLTYKNAARLPETVRKIPLERLLVETDSPYLTPMPYRGKRNEPANVRLVAEKIAELRGITLEEVAERTTQNAVQVYGLSI